MTVTDQNERYKYAKERVKRLKGFYWHLAIFIIINSYILVNIYISSSYNNEEFWNWATFTTLFFWGIGMARHAWKVFGIQFFFSKRWEEEQIEKYIKEEEFERQKWE